MNNLLPLIDMSKDTWKFSESDYLDPYVFNFTFLPNEWFKKTIKKITKECIINGKPKLSTLHRYNYSLEKFFRYLESYNIVLDTFEDITFSIVDGFIHYLLVNVKKPQTRSVALAALEHYIRYGQLFEWGGFPTYEVFDGTENRTLLTEDSLKSRLIDDDVMDKIDSSLRQMKSTLKPTVACLNDVVLWTLITVVRYTGIRLSEALNLNKDCLTKDLMKNDLLNVVSTKNKTERFIPVSKEVVEAIEFLIRITREPRFKMETDKIFIMYQVLNKKYSFLKQSRARKWLKTNFIEQFEIRNASGDLVNLTYHQFRHQIGTDLLNNDLDTFEVTQYLGHESIHSPRLYAKVRNDKLTSEYKKLGFIGVIKSDIGEIVDVDKEKLDSEKRLMAQLPDGVCAKPIGKKVVDCKSPNACLLCSKFITTLEFLDIHKDHLNRLRADKKRYLAENLVGTEYHLFETEKALEEIISRLETLIHKEAKE